ncbi:MAG: hypothetical protein KDA20_09300 [Phycisphaerales bacterium]|nr:hypothetical protein [Phycisphaerales bacterium]
MAATFAGLDLFSSGPHRIVPSKFGKIWFSPYTGTINPNGYTDYFERREPWLLQTGRLIATTHSALITLVQAIQTQAEIPKTGTLVEANGQSWSSMTLLQVQLADRVDRGRVYSVGYELIYVNLNPTA